MNANAGRSHSDGTTSAPESGHIDAEKLPEKIETADDLIAAEKGRNDIKSKPKPHAVKAHLGYYFVFNLLAFAASGNLFNRADSTVATTAFAALFLISCIKLIGIIVIFVLFFVAKTFGYLKNKRAYSKTKYRLTAYYRLRDGGTPKDPEAEYYWLKQAEDNGSMEALGLRCYYLIENGLGVQQGIDVLEKVADLGGRNALVEITENWIDIVTQTEAGSDALDKVIECLNGFSRDHADGRAKLLPALEKLEEERARIRMIQLQKEAKHA